MELWNNEPMELINERLGGRKQKKGKISGAVKKKTRNDQKKSVGRAVVGPKKNGFDTHTGKKKRTKGEMFELMFKAEI